MWPQPGAGLAGSGRGRRRGGRRACCRALGGAVLGGAALGLLEGWEDAALLSAEFSESACAREAGLGAAQAPGGRRAGEAAQSGRCRSAPGQLRSGLQGGCRATKGGWRAVAPAHGPSSRPGHGSSTLLQAACGWRVRVRVVGGRGCGVAGFGSRSSQCHEKSRVGVGLELVDSPAGPISAGVGAAGGAGGAGGVGGAGGRATLPAKAGGA